MLECVAKVLKPRCPKVYLWAAKTFACALVTLNLDKGTYIMNRKMQFSSCLKVMAGLGMLK